MPTYDVQDDAAMLGARFMDGCPMYTIRMLKDNIRAAVKREDYEWAAACKKELERRGVSTEV